jgi:hypothetical protein
VRRWQKVSAQTSRKPFRGENLTQFKSTAECSGATANNSEQDLIWVQRSHFKLSKSEAYE